jgi:hypothetical protein
MKAINPNYSNKFFKVDNMELNKVQKDFKEKVSSEIGLFPEGLFRYVITHPFTFDDGDHYVIVLKKIGDKWLLTDEGHTLMHLSYEDLDLGRGGYREVIENTVSAYSLHNHQGELILPVPETRFGDSLFSFIQALIKISDVKYLQRERIRSLFMEEFKGFLSETIPQPYREFDYSEPEKDPLHVYTIDCLLKAKRKPVFIFGITGDSKCQTSTNMIYWWEKQRDSFDVMAVFENQEDINRKILARFSDVCGRQFSNLATNKDRIKGFINEALVQN